MVRPRTRNTLRILGRVSANDRWGYMFIAPWLIGFFVFTLGPFLASFYLSFTDYKLVGARIGSASRTIEPCSQASGVIRATSMCGQA